MSIIVPSHLAAAIESAQRQPLVRVLVDWDGDGFGPPGSLDDLTGKQGAIKITRQLTTDLPDPVRLTEGSSAASATVELVAGDAFDASMHAARYFTRGTDSPIGHLERINRPAAIDIGFMTEQGPAYVRRMTGRTRNLPSSSRSRSAQLSILDNRARLRTPVQLIPTDGSRAGANGTWVVFQVLAANGVRCGPVPGPGLLMWAPCYGSIQPWLPPPEVPTFGVSFRGNWTTAALTDPSFVPGPFVLAANAFYHSDADILEPIIFKEVFLQPGQTWDGLTARFEVWTLGAVSPTPGPTAPFASAGRVFCQFNNGTDANTGKVVLGVRHNGKLFCDNYAPDVVNVLDAVDSDLVVPGDGAWHAVGVHVDLANAHVTFRLDGAQELKPAPRQLSLPGTSGSYASTPDDATLDITGDIDLRAEVTTNDWTPSSNAAFVAKDNTGQRSYQLGLTTAGALRFGYSTDGTTFLAQFSSAPVPATDGQRIAVRATLDVDNGASGHTVTFYTAPTVTGPWTQLGISRIVAGIVALFSGTAPLQIGGAFNGTVDLFGGSVHMVEVRNGIDGTVVANPDFRTRPAGTTSFTDGAGRAWTVNGSAAIIAAFSLGVVTRDPDTIAAACWVPSSDFFLHNCPLDTPWRDEDIVIEAVLDRSRLELVAVAEPLPLDPQQILSDMSKSEQATAVWDEDGVFRYRTRDRLVDATGGTPQRALTTADASLLDVDISDGIDQVRNIVQVTYTPWNPVSEYHTVLIDDTVRILPVGGTTYTVSFTDLTVFLLTVAFAHTVTEWNLFGPGGTGSPPVDVDPFIAITVNSDGSVDDTDPNGVLFKGYTSNVTCEITQWNAGAAVVHVTNTAPVTLYIAHLSLKGRNVQVGNQLIVEARDEASIAAYGPQGLQLTLPTWVQTGDAAAVLAKTLLGDLAQPRPTVTGLRIVGDPRRQLGDRVILADPDGTQLRGEFWLSQINDDVNASGAYVQEVSARAATEVLRWGEGRWGLETWG